MYTQNGSNFLAYTLSFVPFLHFVLNDSVVKKQERRRAMSPLSGGGVGEEQRPVSDLQWPNCIRLELIPGSATLCVRIQPWLPNST